MPAFLSVNHTIQIRNRVWIIKDPRARFERNTMFSPVDSVFVLTPGEQHLYIQKCSTARHPYGGRDHPRRNRTGSLDRKRAAENPVQVHPEKLRRHYAS